MKKQLLTLLVLLPAVAGATQFDDVVAEVAANNPALKAERAAVFSETMNRIADNRLEATEVGFSHVWGSPGAGNKMSIEVSQGFDWPGVYGVRRRASRSARAAGDSRLQAAERDLRLQVSVALFNVIDANLRCELLERLVANLDSMHTAAEEMFAAGQITVLNHQKVALEEISMQQQLAEAHATRATVLAELAALNGGALPEAAIDMRAYPAQTLHPLTDYLAASAPEVEAAKSEAQALRLDSRAERMGLYPGFSVGYVHEKEGSERFNGFTLGLRLPSYGASPRAKAALLAAEAREQQAIVADQTRRSELTADHAAAEQIALLLTQYETAFDHGDYETLLRRSLNGGQMSYTEYFSELNFFLGSRLECLTQTLRYHTLLATLNSRL